jgi:hypothetical protein
MMQHLPRSAASAQNAPPLLAELQPLTVMYGAWSRPIELHHKIGAPPMSLAELITAQSLRTKMEGLLDLRMVDSTRPAGRPLLPSKLHGADPFYESYSAGQPGNLSRMRNHIVE